MKTIRTYRNPATGREASVRWDRATDQYDIARRNGDIDLGIESCADLDDAHDAAKEWIAQTPNNIEFIARLMAEARTGPLMQALVIESLARYATQVADSDPEQCGNMLINGHAWHACAKEALAALNARGIA
jgi:hypothetical protein